MKVTFIRHASLRKPFDNYDKLSFEEINNLATGSIDPDISNSSQQTIADTLSRLESVGNSPIIVHASSKRGKQTSRLIKQMVNDLFDKQAELIELDALDEIYFEPKKMISLQEYKSSGLSNIREVMFSHLSGEDDIDGIEDINEILKRVKKVERQVLELSKIHDSIICVTHGFFMRVLQLYFLSGIKTKKNISKEALFHMANFSNGKGFYVEFEHGENISQKRIKERVEAFNVVRNIPYKIDSPEQDSSCVTKNRIFAEILQRQGYKVDFFQGRFSWQSIGLPQSIIKLAPGSHKPRHIFVKVRIPELGDEVVADVTWNKDVNSAIELSDWTGFTDSKLAVECNDIHQLNVQNPTEIKKNSITSEYKAFIEAINNYIEDKYEQQG